MLQRSGTTRSTYLPCWGRLSNRQGAVFLLAVYFAALTLLLLGGVSLQHTNIEARAAQVFRDQQQAFWLAEGALDKALLTLAANPKNVAPYTAQDLNGTYGYTVTNLAITFGADGNIQATQRIIGQGNAGGIPKQVFGVVNTPMHIHGLLANNQIEMCQRRPPYFENLSYYFNPVYLQMPNFTVTGDVRTASGTSTSIYLEDRDITIKGDVIVNVPDPVRPYSGILTGRGPAVRMDFSDTITGDAYADAMTPLGPPELPPACQHQDLQPWVIKSGKYRITSKDQTLDGSKPDGVLVSETGGVVTICTSDVTVKEGAKLTFADPTLLYVKDGGFHNNGAVKTTDNFDNRADRGLIVALTAGGATVGDFQGSIYAPKGWIGIGPSASDTQDAQDLYAELKDDVKALKKLQYDEYKNLPSDPEDRQRELAKRRRAIEQLRNQVAREADNLEAELVKPIRRSFGFMVGAHIVVNGVDVALRKPSAEKKNEQPTSLPLLNWTN